MDPIYSLTGTILITITGVILTVWRQQVIAQRRATVDLMVAFKQDQRLGEAFSKVSLLIKANEQLSAYCSDTNSEEYLAINLILSIFEISASGIREGVYHEAVYQRMRHTTVVKMWEALKGFVYQERIRIGSNTLFQDFEWLAQRWINKPLKSDNK
jgi:hypothetical protein